MPFKNASQLTVRDFETGFVLTEVGTSKYYHTGDWRSKMPKWDNTKCVKCGVCYIYCPDNSVHRGPDGYFTADLDYCKGCGICARECITNCISMVEEK